MKDGPQPLPLLASICPWVSNFPSFRYSLCVLRNFSYLFLILRISVFFLPQFSLRPSRCLHAPLPIFLAFFYRVTFLSLPVIWNIIQPSNSCILTHDGWLYPWNTQHRVECRFRSARVLDSLLKITLHKSVFIS